MMGEAPQNLSGPLKVYEVPIVPITQSHGGHFSTPGLLKVYRISSLPVGRPAGLACQLCVSTSHDIVQIFQTLL